MPPVTAAANESLPEQIVTQGVVDRYGAPAVIVLAAVLLFARLGTRALWSSEFRWAEIAREMIITHDYFWPTINGHVYFDKPLGSYWLVVAATWLTGAMDEAAARIPCAIAGVLAVLLLIQIGRRLYDQRTAVIAGLILATSFSFVFYSRHASADVETISGELAALLVFLRNNRDFDHDGAAGMAPGWWVVALWLIMAVTSLTKGLLGFALPMVVIGTYSILGDGWAALRDGIARGGLADRWRWIITRNRWFLNWYTPAAIALASVIYYLPFAISHMRTGSTAGIYMVYRENVERYFEPFDHRGPIYLYTYVIFALMAPWSAFIPAAIVHAHRRQEAAMSRSDRFTLVFFWATFAFFTISGSRRSYYILPILPAAAMLIARLLSVPRASLFDAGWAVMVAAVLLSTLAFIPPSRIIPSEFRWSMLPTAPARGVLGIYWAGSIVAIIYALRSFDTRRVAVAVSAIAYLFMFYFFVFAMPAGDAWRGERSLAIETRRLIGPDTARLAFFRNVGPVFYLGLARPVPEYNRVKELDAAVRSGRVRWIVVLRRDLGRLDFPFTEAASEAVFPWDSDEHRRNAMVLINVPTPGAGATAASALRRIGTASRMAS
jgi:4-amino-4-deoxy-L-arabinose transferase-like glycosyltransferase